MYDTSTLMLVLICWQKQRVPGQAQVMDETNHNDIQYSSVQASKIDRKCVYDQQPAGNSGHHFALHAEDLMLLCDKEAPNRG